MVRKLPFCRSLLLSLVIIIGGCFYDPGLVGADETRWEVGAQGGWSYDDDEESFNQADIIVAYRLPLQWQRWDVLNVSTRLTAMAGVLDGGGDTGLLGTLGL
jgi:hypothetical protein